MKSTVTVIYYGLANFSALGLDCTFTFDNKIKILQSWILLNSAKTEVVITLSEFN